MMNRLRDIATRHIWCIYGLVVAVFVLLSLQEKNLLGQLCLIASMVCMVVAQVDRLEATGSRREAILGPIAVVLSLIGLILIWPE
jgi:hypothetical protein